MNDIELFKQALNALEDAYHPNDQVGKVMDAIRERLAQPEHNKKDILRIRQEEWRKAQQISKDYIDDPECCFALGFDAGYGAVAQKVEPPAMESGGGFESLPASPKKWVGLTDEEIHNDDGIMSANSGYGATFETLRELARAIEQALKEKNA